LHKLYGRRKGKRLRQRQDGLVSTLLPQIELDLSSGAIAPEVLFGRRPAEIRLEIGFGDGARLIEQATSNPDVGFIGCEPFLNGVAKALAAIEDGALHNVRVHNGDAREVLAALPPQSVDRIELLYPDPWPKRRHNKRRILSDEFLTAAARVLKTGAALRFATDIDDYCGWGLARVLRSPDFTWTAERPTDWLQPWDGWQATRYEQKARHEGRTSAYLTFVRN
jgi:tRNA (guanine-N7-)-methyltransferase